MDKEKPKIFLSYAREDMGMAKQLYNDLKRYGLDVWLDTESLVPGDRWKDKIQDTIESSNYFIELLSNKSVSKKGFVQKELKTALEVLVLFSSSERFILPVRLDDCEVCERKLKDLNWVDLFPENEYENGFRKILRVVSPGTFLLRSKQIKLTYEQFIEMVRIHNFYETSHNPRGKGIPHKYQLLENNGDKVVFDDVTGLTWQQSGTPQTMIFFDAKKWIEELNRNEFAGFNDWRMPTLEEAMSLMEPEKKKYYLNIDPIFNSKQEQIWTADLIESRAWVIFFTTGSCFSMPFFDGHKSYVRAVRSGQASVE